MSLGTGKTSLESSGVSSGGLDVINGAPSPWDYYVPVWLQNINNYGPCFQFGFSGNLGGSATTSNGAGFEWPFATYTSGTAIGSITGPRYNVSPANNGPLTQMIFRHTWRLKLSQTANGRTWAGLGISNQASGSWEVDSLAFAFVGFRLSTGLDNQWVAFMNDGGQTLTTNTGVLLDLNFHTFEVRFAFNALGNGSVSFLIDNVVVATFASNLISQTYLGPNFLCDNKAAGVAVGFSLTGWRGVLIRKAGAW